MNYLFKLMNQGASGLLTWSWQVLWLLSATWLLLKIMRPASAARRHQHWLIGLLAIAASPFCSLFVQQLAASNHDDTAYIYWLTLPPSLAISNPIEIVKSAPATLSGWTNSWNSWIGPLVFSLWLVGFCLALRRCGAEWLMTQRLRHTAQAVTWDELNCGLVHNLQIGLSAEVQSPMLVGLFRPLILLPADIASWTSQSERRAMLQHELAHWERRDQYTNLLQALLQAVFFFHPMVCFVCRQMNLKREIACDDCVMSLGTDAATYAESILKVAEHNLASCRLRQPAFFSTKQFLERRISMIMSPARNRNFKPSRRLLLLTSGVLALLSFWLSSNRVNGSNATEAVDESNAASTVTILNQTEFARIKAEASGKVFVVNLWATWCPPCRKEMAEFVKLNQRYYDQGVQFVLISADETAKKDSLVAPFLKQANVEFPAYVADTDLQALVASVDKKWNGALPATFVVNKNGQLTFAKYGVISPEELTQKIEEQLR